jgi:hypothetical protein
MDLSVRRSGDWWVLLDGEAPLRTPGGSPVVSRHRELAEEMAADVERHGADPMAKVSTFSLQASYLDFGIPVRREALEENAASIWPDDLLVVRPTRPAFAEPLLRLWGTPPTDRAAVRESLRALTLRQLMATLMAGNVLRSAALGVRVVTTDDDLAPLARGACERAFVALGAGEVPERGQVRKDGSKGRFRPVDMDETTCTACCAGAVPERERFLAGCAVASLLGILRRFAAWPEETAKK